MDEDKISVISLRKLSSNEVQTEDKETEEKIVKEDETSLWNICHVISVLSVCVAFIATITLVPRTNSIFYQSYWYEFNFCALVCFILVTANNSINMATYFNEKSLLTFWIMFRMYSIFVLAWAVPYIIAYLIWCHYLNYNWPIPFLGYNYVLVDLVRPATIWISFPRDFRKEKIFKKNFKVYILYMFMALTCGILKEVISVLLKTLPGYLQWIIAFLIQMQKSFEIFVMSRLVNRMEGGREEASQILLRISIDISYSIFIAVRLPDANLITVFFIIAVDFFLLLQTSYKIVQLHKRVTEETAESAKIERQRMVTELVLAELTEGMTPLAYAIGIAMAYYGYNGTILGNIKNGFWGYKPIDDIGYLFQMMILLFGFDIFSTLINSFVLSISTNIKLLREFCSIMKRYWHFFAIKYASNILLMFVIKDINLGMDTTGEFNWITNDGRIELINGSTDLSYEEKSVLLN